jgi:GNAT superfamily N-acetyltransferase
VREQDFLALPRRVYARDPYWIDPGLCAERQAWLDPEYAGHQATFLAVTDDEPTARCVARHRPGTAIGTIGFFEALDDPEACRSLLTTAEEWLRQRGAAQVLGPMDGDTWQRYRWATGTLAHPPFLKEPWNPSYYPERWTDCGYTVTDQYYSARIRDPAAAHRALTPFAQRVARQGYTFRPIRLSAWQTELTTLYRLSTAIFAENRHYAAIGLDAFIRLYQDARPLIVPDLCQFCCAPDGKEIGFVFCYPDFANAVRAMRGHRNGLAKLRFLWHRRQANRVCIKSLGSLPRYHGTGIGPALMASALAAIVRLGYREALMCLMQQDNDSRRLDGGGSEPFRSYALYEKALRHE